MIRLFLYSSLLLLCLACNHRLTLREAFDKVASMERFEVTSSADCHYRFPGRIGEGTMCVHPNSSLREDIFDVLSALPDEWLVCELKQGPRTVIRYYIEPGAPYDNVLCVLVGEGSADTLVGIFSKENIDEVKRNLAEVKKLRE